jgi:starch synthase
LNLLLTHPGTQHAPYLAAQLHRRGILYKFATGIAFGQLSTQRPITILPKKLQQIRARRAIRGVPSNKIVCLPFHDMLAMFKKRMGYHNDDIYYFTNGWFERKIPIRFLKNADAVIGFDTSSRILVMRSHAVCKPYILDVSIAHPVSKEQIHNYLRKKYPLWNNEIKPKLQRNIDAELYEMEAADHIVVATQFTKKTYLENGVPASKISVNPYGTQLDFFQSKWDVRQYQPSPQPVINYLFFGSISARKGFPWLCQIWERFHAENPNSKLVAAGHGSLPPGFVLPKGVEFLGAIHPNKRTELFHTADVFVFPSFFEGFAQVIIEAMACGLPVITTTHTVGPEVISNGVEGFVLEPGDDDSLTSALAFFTDYPEKMEAMGRAARQRVLPLTWDAYGDRWEAIASHVIKNYPTVH